MIFGDSLNEQTLYASDNVPDKYVSGEAGHQSRMRAPYCSVGKISKLQGLNGSNPRPR